MTENEMVGWYHQFSGHELGQTSGDGEGQRGLECCSPLGHKEQDTTGRLNNNKRQTSVTPKYWQWYVSHTVMFQKLIIPKIKQ